MRYRESINNTSLKRACFIVKFNAWKVVIYFEMS